jgi:hypothetical protein
MNDGIDFCVLNFHHFANIRKAININKRFLIVFYILIFFKLYIYIQCVVGLVGKIFLKINKILLPYMVDSQNMFKFCYG